jgi:two-component system NtrC family response regulator
MVFGMNKKRLLIIEDEISVAKQLKWGLRQEYEITIAHDADQARPLLASGTFHVALLDLGLPPYSDTPQEGLKLLSEMFSLSSHTKVIVITGNAEEENAIQAIALGAADFCAKPIDLKLLNIILSRTFRIHRLEEANRQLQQQTQQGGSFCGMLGISPAMRGMFDLIRQVSRTDFPVIITGESGTGKEMAALAIHNSGSRAQNPLVIINCGAIPENLLESELFGHEKGAFTGATGRKLGKLEHAEKGTIFLDEIGELPLPLQVKILRFLQEGTVERIGSTQTISLDVRIIAATNVNLEDRVQQGSFREDLFHRLNVVPLNVPPLRKREEDILLLAHHFLRAETENLGRQKVVFSPAAIAVMGEHPWPGNVRELQNRIRRALGTTASRFIAPADMGLTDTAQNRREQKLLTLREVRQIVEIKVIQKALAMAGNNISQAAKLLDISRPTLHDLLKKHGINP